MTSQTEIVSDALWRFHSEKFSSSESENAEEISSEDLWTLASTNNGYRLGALLRLAYLPEEILLELCQIFIDDKVGFISIEYPSGLTNELAECSRIPRYLFSEFDFDDSLIQMKFWNNPATPPNIIYRIGESRKQQMKWDDEIAHIYNPYQMGSRRHSSEDYLDSLMTTTKRLREAIRTEEDLAEFNALFE
jgi:hypothetical protein